MKLLFAILLCLLVPALASAAAPKVVKATPDNGQTDVDPKTCKEMRIVFDQPMNTDGSCSVVGGGSAFPKFIGKPKWVDKKTFVWLWKLEPEHDYALSINNDTYKNFTSGAGESAESYPISFSTGKAGAAAKAPASAPAVANQAAIDVLRKAIDDDYSYRDRLKIDWDKEFEAHAAKLKAARTPNEFAREAANLLRVANDVHLGIRVGKATIGTAGGSSTPPNINVESLKRLVPNWSEGQAGIITGKFPDGIGYLLIPSWTAEQPPAVERAVQLLKDTKAMIVDVRPNGGGDEASAQKVAGLFVPQAKIYSKNRYRQGGQWGEVFDRLIEPRKDLPRYDKPVAVLIGPKCVSSNESFVLMMKQDPSCTLIGSTTRGSSGNPKPHDLGNGVTVYLPSWEDQLPDGTVLEGKGVAPDIEVKTRLADFQSRDPVLEAALTKLREAKK